MSDLTNVFTDIADAIRAKTETQITYKPTEMANAINNIETGGGALVYNANGVSITQWFNAPVTISEDVISDKVERFPTAVLNQWTYHSRLYAAAKYIGDVADMNFIQLVSFGCGVDAITTDEVRSILEKNGKIYTQLKIDEITNLGAVKIRLRSLFAAIGHKEN